MLATMLRRRRAKVNPTMVREEIPCPEWGPVIGPLIGRGSVGRGFLRDGRLGAPGGAAFFPLIVSELLNVGAVGVHHEDLAVGLRRPGVKRLVFESHARAGEEETLAV